MEKRPAVPGDKLVLVEYDKHRVLVPQSGDKVEVIVASGVVTEVDYIMREWRWFCIPHTLRMIEDAIFFYKDPSKPPEIRLTSDRKTMSLEKFSLGTKFVVTKYRRVFKSVSSIFFGEYWCLADEAPGWEPYRNTGD